MPSSLWRIVVCAGVGGLVFGVVFVVLGLVWGLFGAPVVLVDDGHRPLYSVYSNDSRCPGCFGEAVRLLEREGFVVRVAGDGEELLEGLGGAAVVVLPCSLRGYEEDVVDGLVEFVGGGGGLLVMGDYDNYPRVVEAVSGRFGVLFGAPRTGELDAVADEEHAVGGNPTVVRLSDGLLNRGHPVLEGVEAVVLYSASTLIAGGGDWLLVAGRGARWYYNGSSVAGEPFAVALSYGWGRVVVVGDSTLWTTFDYDGDGVPALYEEGNARFLVNIVRWLAGGWWWASFLRVLGFALVAGVVGGVVACLMLGRRGGVSLGGAG